VTGETSARAVVVTKASMSVSRAVKLSLIVFQGVVYSG
jgi:hypothetical protein